MNNSATKYTKLTEGTKVYYTGDMANVDGAGVITKVNPPDRWYAVSYNIVLEDGRECLHIMPSNFGMGGGCRFQVMSEREAARAASIRAFATEQAARGSQQAIEWLAANPA